MQIESVTVKKTVIALSVVLGLSGCGLMQQYQLHQMQEQQDQKMAQFDAESKLDDQTCKNQLMTNPSLDPLRAHVSFSIDDATVEQLASTKKPTAKEKTAILLWDQIASGCFDARIKLLEKYGANAAYAQNLRTLKSSQTQLKASLWAGKISYGQYLKTSQENIAGYRKENIAIESNLQQQARQAQMQQAQINAVNAQAAAAVMSAQAQQQSANAQTMMMFNQAQQQQRQKFNAPGSPTNPVQTNCTSMGGTVNCQTYSY